MTNAAIIARAQKDIALMLEGRATPARDRAIAVARRLIADATAEDEAAAEIIRVRGLTPAQTRWLHDPVLGHTGAYKLNTWGATWVEGTRADLLAAYDAASHCAGMVLQEIEFGAECASLNLPEHLQQGFAKRQVERTEKCLAKAARKIAKALGL